MTMDPTQPTTPAIPPAAVPAGPSPVPVVAIAPRARSNGILNLLLIGAAIIAVGGVAFAVGRSTAPASAFQRIGALPGGTVVRPDGSFAPGGADGAGGLAVRGAPSMDGTVTAIDADSLTMKLANGDEITFTLDASTTYREATDALPADVAVGDDVSVKVAGNGRLGAGGNGQTPDLTAGDVTVSR